MVLKTCNNLVKFIGYSLTFGEFNGDKGTHYNCVHSLQRRMSKFPRSFVLLEIAP